jgi:hypothetical protein
LNRARAHWGKAALGLLAATALIGLVLASANLRALLTSAIAQVTPLSVLATFPGQAAAALICAGALRALRPGVSYMACLGARLLRDGGGNLPIFLPGFGEALGARALVLAGGETRAAISASAIDKVIETIAQVPFIMLAAWVLWHEWHVPLEVGGVPVAGLLGVVLALLLIAMMLWRKFGARSELALRLSDEWSKFVVEARQQRSGLPLSLGLHVLAWLSGGLQIWMAAAALGYELNLFEAIAVESAAYAGRAVFFFIPAGLVTQEAGLLAAGLVFGLLPTQALALGLVLRLRDALMALALLIWPLLEWRRRRAAH